MTEKKRYALLHADSAPYLSDEEGALGRNGRARTYDGLDRSVASSALEHGETYAKVRVSFKDEAMVIAAGHRPCGRCMEATYGRWRAATEAGELWAG